MQSLVTYLTLVCLQVFRKSNGDRCFRRKETKRRGRVVTTPASNLEGRWFKYQPGDWLS
jgi:hypothetical protein